MKRETEKIALFRNGSCCAQRYRALNVERSARATRYQLYGLRKDSGAIFEINRIM